MAEQKTWVFKFTLFGVEKVFNIKGATMEEARKNLDRVILNKVKMTSAKEESQLNKTAREAVKGMEDLMDKSSDLLNTIFGGKKDKK